jgi:RNA polymerase sigma factor (sigma-70 family)
MTDDAELLRQYARDGSEAAFAELVQRHLDLVYSAALRRVGGDTHLAKDVAQQVFIALGRQASSLSGHPVLVGWLYTTSRFAAAQVVRTEKRRQAREQEAHLMQDSPLEPSADPEWQQLRPVLDEAMDQLGARDREALLLRYFSGGSFAAVGEKLGVTEEAARKRVDRALDQLRTRLARRGIRSPAMAVAMLLESRAVSAAPGGLAATVSSAALSVPAAGVTAAGLLQLMSTSKLIVGAAILGAVLTATVATREARADLRASAFLANATRENEALLVRSRAIEREIAAVTRERDGLRDSVTAFRAEADRQAADDIAKGIRDPEVAGHEFVAAHPEAVALVTSATRIRLLGSYGALFRSLQLTPAQIEAFIDLRIKSGEGGLRWNTEVQSPVAEFSLGDLSSAEREDGIRTLLGTEGYRQYLDFSRQEPARNLASELAKALYFTPAPLSSDQARQLTQLFVQGSANYQQGKSVDLAAVNWDDAIAQAQAFLSPPQIAALRENRLQRQASLALRNGVRSAQQAFQAGNSPTTISK